MPKSFAVRILLFLAAPLLLANTSDPETIPQPIRALLDAAMEAGSDSDVTVLMRYARGVSPESAEAVAALVESWRTERRRAHERELRQAGFFELVKGRAELGGYATTGNTHTTGLSGVLDMRREALKWRHKLRLQVDYQESRGVISREHYLAAYEPNYKIDDRSYVYGAAQFESDRFLGYDERYSLSAGFGYVPVRGSGLTVELELGPAFRQTNFTDGTTEGTVGGRGSLDLDWKLSPTITFLQNASAYIQNANSTLLSKTAVRAKLFGPVSGQLSYQLQYESAPPAGSVSTDTTTRASVVVDF